MANEIRVNIRVSKQVKEWFENKSEETGISQSALMSMALSDHIEQKEGLKAMGNMSFFIDKLDQIGVDKLAQLGIANNQEDK